MAVGLVIGLMITAFANTTPLIYEFICGHPLGFVAGAMVVLAGRFTSGGRLGRVPSRYKKTRSA